MSFQKYNCFILFYILFVKSLTTSQELRSPCRNVFEYIYDGSEWLGQIKINPPANTEQIVLNVTLSIGVILPSRYVGTLELQGARTDVLDNLLRGQPLLYRLRFPLPSPIPKVTSIVVNNNVLCKGPPVTNNIVTTLRLEHTLTIPKSYFTPNENIFTNNFQKALTNGFVNTLKNQYFNTVPQANDQSVDYNNLPNVLNNNHQLTFQQVPSTFSLPKNEFSIPNSERTNPSYNSFYPFTQMHFNEKNIPSFDTPKIDVLFHEYPSTPKYPSNNEHAFEVNTPKQNTPNGVSDRTSDNTAEICGLSESVNPLIVKGNQTHRGQYPWIAAMFVQVIRGLEFKCSGTLVSHRHIVTAAHCIQIYNNPKLNPEDLVIFLGKHNIRKWTDEDNSLIVEAQNITLHPDFEPNTLGFGSDIAVITLSKKVKYTQYIRPACLWTTNNDLSLVHNKKGVVTGWGRDEKGNRMTNEPLQSQLPIVTQEDCIRSHSRFSTLTSNRTFCAGERNGIGPCNGDSGSGFILQQNNRWALRGIVSVSLLDKTTLSCDLNEYIVFTDVAKYTDWLLTFDEQN